MNRGKHGIGFEEASCVFDDPRVILFDDMDHSDSEDRYIAIGASDKARVIIVSHTYRGNVIRIISARRATAGEVRIYAQR